MTTNCDYVFYFDGIEFRANERGGFWSDSPYSITFDQPNLRYVVILDGQPFAYGWTPVRALQAAISRLGDPCVET